MWANFEMPDGRGSGLDVLNRARAGGLDVRVIFWRPDPETASWKSNAFWGSAEQIDLLRESQSAIGIRWDRAQPGFCQHQKCWLMDAGTDTETCFLGGINLNPHSMVSPGHRGDGHNHDIYLELTGPSAVDVHHNFVQRWNEAAGIVGLAHDGQRKPVWIHSKLMLVDGQWGTVGHLHRYSLFGNCELNAAFWDQHTAGALLSELLREHLERDCSGMDDRCALRFFHTVAADNARLFKSGHSAWPGLAISLLA